MIFPHNKLLVTNGVEICEYSKNSHIQNEKKNDAFKIKTKIQQRTTQLV